MNTTIIFSVEKSVQCKEVSCHVDTGVLLLFNLSRMRRVDLWIYEGIVDPFRELLDMTRR